MKFIEDELAGMDCVLLFKKENHLIAICTNGYVENKFLVDADDQDTLFDFINNEVKSKSSYNIVEGMKKVYPVIDDFVEFARIGLFAYDMHDGVETLVVEPTMPLLVSELPDELQELLPEF